MQYAAFRLLDLFKNVVLINEISNIKQFRAQMSPIAWSTFLYNCQHLYDERAAQMLRTTVTMYAIVRIRTGYWRVEID